jgi:hypothetical protein
MGGRTYLDEEDVGAGFCEGEGHGLPNSSCAACYEGGLPGEGEELLDCGHRGCDCGVLVSDELYRRDNFKVVVAIQQLQDYELSSSVFV